MRPMSPTPPTTVRIEPALRHRLEALAPRLKRVPTYGALGTLTLSKLLRLALLRGIDALEAELDAKRGSR